MAGLVDLSTSSTSRARGLTGSAFRAGPAHSPELLNWVTSGVFTGEGAVVARPRNERSQSFSAVTSPFLLSWQGSEEGRKLGGRQPLRRFVLPATSAMCQRIDAPVSEGDIEDWPSIHPFTLGPEHRR